MTRFGRNAAAVLVFAAVAACIYGAAWLLAVVIG